MNTIAIPRTPCVTADRHLPTRRMLDGCVATWLAVALAGQFLFAGYVAVFYGGAALDGRFEDFNQVLPHGWVAGEPLMNAVVLLHVAFTVLIIAGGALQLLPVVRRVAPALHRWNGRLYILSASVLALGGLAMVLFRGGSGGGLKQLGIVINALLILAFAALALRAARQRNIAAHRRWALRLFLAVSGVWFFRIGLMFWIAINGGPAGFDPETFTGPALDVIGFLQFLLPLALLEAWLRTRERSAPVAQALLSSVLVAAIGATTLGIFVAARVLWLPHF